MAKQVDGIDWPGLYRWSIKYSDGTSPKCRLSDEDVAFLKGAIQSAFAQMEDPKAVTEEQVRVLEEFLAGKRSVCDCIAALSVLQRLIDDYPELSRDFKKLHALEPLIRLLSLTPTDGEVHLNTSDCEEQLTLQRNAEQRTATEVNSLENPDEGTAAKVFVLLEKALEILGNISQNNPEIQQAVADLDGLRLLFSLVQANPRSRELRIRSLQTLSCFLRNHRPSEVIFLNSGGLRLLVTCILSGDIKEKAASLSRHLLAEGLLSFERALDANLFEASVKLILGIQDLENIQYVETVMQLVILLLQHHRVALARASLLENITAALKSHYQRLSSRLPQLENEQAMMGIRDSMEVATSEEKKRLDDIEFDVEAVHSQLQMTYEALRLTDLPNVYTASTRQPKPQQHRHQTVGNQHDHNQHHPLQTHHEQNPQVNTMAIADQRRA